MKITPLESRWIQENIEKIDFLNFLDITQIESLVEHLEPRLLAGTQPVIREGQQGQLFFFIYNGRVSVTVERQGKKTRLATLSRGDFFGEISLLSGKPATANVTASAPTKVFFLDNEHFLSLIRGSKKLSEHMVMVMKNRLKEKQKAVEELQYGSLDEINQAIKIFLNKKP